MCLEQIVISKNSYGQLIYCEECKVFTLTFNNILIEFSVRELKAFHLLVKEIDANFWNSHPNKTIIKRNIPIATSQANLILIFDLIEFKALKELIFISDIKRKSFISSKDINYTLVLN